VAQTRVARDQSISRSGQPLAMHAAASRLSPTAALHHQHGGLAGIQALKQLDDSLEDAQALEELAVRFRAIHQAIASAPQQFMWVSEKDTTV